MKNSKYRLEYYIGKKHLQTVCVNMTKGFCSIKKKELKDSGRFELGKFKMFKT